MANANANEMANEVGPNEVEANAVDPTYHCDCGCNVKFIDYVQGIDLYIGEHSLITANRMVDYYWRDYVRPIYKIWGELREDIILRYNDALNYEPSRPEDGPWVHLYYREVYGRDLPLNEKLDYEFAF
jgi:hypothetical protein